MTFWYCVTILFLSSNNNVTAYLVPGCGGSSLNRDSWTSLNRDFPLPRHLRQGVPTTVRDRVTPAWPVFSPGGTRLRHLPREASDTDASAGSSRCGGAAALHRAPHLISTLPNSFRPTASGILSLRWHKFSIFIDSYEFCIIARELNKHRS